MKNYECEVLIEFNDKLSQSKRYPDGKKYKEGSIYKCTKERYLELKELGALKLLKIKRR